MKSQSGRSVPLVFLCFAGTIYIVTPNAEATPQFARETGLPCRSCHSYPPRLNSTGQKFFNDGFRIVGGKGKSTLQLWAQIGARAATSEASGLPVKWDNSAIGTAGRIDGSRATYRAIWRERTNEIEFSANMNVSPRFSISAGHLPLMSQFDPRLRLGISGPAGLAPPNDSGEAPFAASGDAWAIRFVGSTESAAPFGNGWKIAATVPFSREFGSNVADGADRELSSSPKGYLVEVYGRIDLDSYGLTIFKGEDRRRYVGIAFQKFFGKFCVEGSAGKSESNQGAASAFSLGVDWIPRHDMAVGVRTDVVDGDGSITPFMSASLGGNETILRFIIESKWKRGDQPATSMAISYRF